MKISLFAKLIFFLALYCISDLAIKNNILRRAIKKANNAKPINWLKIIIFYLKLRLYLSQNLSIFFLIIRRKDVFFKITNKIFFLNNLMSFIEILDKTKVNLTKKYLVLITIN